MNKMIPVFLVLAVVALAGLAIAGYSMRKNAGSGTATQMTYPSGSPAPTAGTAIQENPSSGNYQSGITLTISSPSNGSTVANANVTVTGKTAPNAEVFVNDASGESDANGNFSITTSLDEGENTIVVSANDANGNSAEQEVKISYTPA